MTNGVVYQFYSDLNAPNVMDDEPFLSFNLIDDDPALFTSAIRQFSKEKFNVKNVISKAVYQKYSKVVQKTLKDDLVSPSDELVKYFLSRPEIKTGNRITSQMIERYREATQKAMQKVFGVVIKEDAPEQPEQNTSEPSKVVEAPKEEPILSLESISKAILDFSAAAVPDFSYQEETYPDFTRLHIYTTEKRKYGVVKIQKADLSIHFRKLVNGKPEIYDLKSLDELKKCMKAK